MTHVRTAVIAALALLAFACAADEPDPAGEPDDDANDVAAADDTDDIEDTDDSDDVDDVEITLLTHDSFDISEDVIAAFEEETGIGVSIVPLGDAGTALNQTILTADDPQGDLLFGVDNAFLSRAIDEGIFTPYTSPMLEHVDDDLILDPDHRVTPVDVGDVCLNYDVAWFDEHDVEVPGDLDDLTDPAYEGLLTVMNPATSSPGLSFLLATVERFGTDGYLEYWEELVANDVVVTQGWSEAYYDEFSGAGDGERPLVVSYASSPPAEVFFADPQPDTAPTGVIEASCFRQIEHVGILDGTPHEDEARRFVDYMLDLPFQEDLPLTMFVFPVRDDAELPEVFVEHAVVPDDPLEIDPFEIGEHREDWIEAWTDVVLR